MPRNALELAEHTDLENVWPWGHASQKERQCAPLPVAHTTGSSSVQLPRMQNDGV